MNSITLQEAVEKYDFSRNKFCGVFPYDMIPKNISKPCSIIINTDPSYLPGKHWVAISIDSKGNCNYFDSFGEPPNKYKIIHFLQKNCLKKVFSSVYMGILGQYELVLPKAYEILIFKPNFPFKLHK
jgi:hypothetical protein